MKHLLEFFGFGQLLQAAPVFFAMRTGELRANGVQINFSAFPHFPINTSTINVLSSMAHGAVSELRKALFADVVFRQQFATLLDLIGRRLPFHVENLVLGPKIALGRFVAIETPAHEKRMSFPGERHFIDAAVTG